MIIGIGVIFIGIPFTIGLIHGLTGTESKSEKVVAEKKVEEEAKNEQEASNNQKKESIAKVESKKNEDSSKIAKEEVSYDQLESLYLKINEKMSYEEILKIVEETGLPFTEVEYNGSKKIKVAFTEGVAKQRYADSGDNLEISFDQESDRKYAFGTLEYFNNDKFVTIFQYEGGTYWDFYNCQDKGYFINDIDNKGNYEMTFNNGKKKKTKYIKANSKEEQLRYINKKKK